MADLIPPPEQTDDTSPDYLGKEAARSFKAQPALPVAGPIIGGGGTGPAGATAVAPRVTREPSGLAVREDPAMRAIAEAISALQTSGSLKNVAQRVWAGMPPETVQQSDIFSDGVNAGVDTFTRGSAPAPLPPGSPAEAAALGDLNAAAHDEISSFASQLPSDVLRAAGGIGGVMSLVNMANAIRQGRVPEGIQSALQAAGAIARFAPEAWGLTTPFAAGAAGAGAGAGAGAAGLAGESGAAAAAGETAAGGAAGAGGAAAGTLAGAAGGIAIPFVVGKAVEMIVNGLGYGNRDLGDYIRSRNEMAAGHMGSALSSALQTAKTPADLLSIANATQGLGQGQVQFHHDLYGFGGDYNDPMSPTFKAALERAATDPAALRDFIRGVHITMGPTGTPADNYALTDLFRRNLAHAAGFSDAETAGLFEPTPEGFTPAGMARNLSEMTGEGYDPAVRTIAEQQLDAIRRGEMGSMPINVGPLSPYYRTPAEMQITPQAWAEIMGPNAPPLDFAAGTAAPVAQERATGFERVARAAMGDALAREQAAPMQQAPGGGGTAAMLEALGLLNEGAP